MRLVKRHAVCCAALLVTGSELQSAGQAWCLLMIAAAMDGLLGCLAKEPVAIVQRKLVHAIAIVASRVSFAEDPAKTASAATTQGSSMQREGDFVLPTAWPELMSAFGTLISSTDPPKRVLGLFLGSTLMGVIGDALAMLWAAPLVPVLKAALVSPPNAETAIASARTAATVMRALNLQATATSDEARASAAAAATAHAAGRGGTHGASTMTLSTMTPLLLTVQKELLAPVLTVVRNALGHVASEDGARHIIQDLISLVREKPAFVRPLLTEVVSLMLAVVDQENMEESTRVCAMEFLVTLSEMGGGMMRKEKKQLTLIVTLACRRMAMLDEDPTWAAKPCHSKSFSHDADEIDDALLTFAGQALDRLASTVGGKTIMPIVMATVGPWTKHSDWRLRRAACLAVGAIGEGSKSAMAATVASVARTIAEAFEDPHPRVRFVALAAIAQLASDFMEPIKGHKSFQAQTHSWLMPALLKVCSKANAATGPEAASCGGAEQAFDKVRHLAMHALQIFMHPQRCRPSHVKPLDPLMRELYDALTTGSMLTRVEALTAVSALSSVIEGEFTGPYSTFMPVVTKLVADSSAAMATDPAAVELRNAAVQCVGSMCSVVPKELCAPDAHALMEAIKPSFTIATIAADKFNSFEAYALAVAHMARALGADFARYLPDVLPLLLHISTQQIESTMVALDQDEADAHKDQAAGVLHTALAPTADAGIVEFVTEIPGLGFHRVTFDTMSLRQKVAAAGIIFQVLQQVQEAALGYLEPLTESVLSCAAQPSSEACRSIGVATMPVLVYIASMDAAHPDRAVHVMGRCLDALFDGLAKETGDDVINGMAEAITELFKIAAATGPRMRLTDSQLSTTLKRLAHSLEISVQRWTETAIAYHE